MEVQQKIDFIKELIQKGDLGVAQEELSKIIRIDPKNTKAFQLLAKIFINNDELENANKLFEQRKEIPSTYEEKITWAILLEEIGNLNDAISDYHEILKINPSDARIHYKLGVLYLDKYDYENALVHFKEIIRKDPGFIRDHDEIAELYKELGLMGMVKEILTPSSGNGIFNDFKIDIMVKEDSANKVIDFTNLNESFYDKYISLFSGREGVIARQWTDNEGNSGYSPVYEELNEENISKHIRGDITLGIYPIDKNNQVNFAALDIDLRKNIAEDTVLGEERLKEFKNQVLVSAGIFKKIVDRLQLEAYLEDSGYKGIHIWFFFYPKIDAKDARNFLLMLVKKANLTKPEIHIEVFPKQNTVEEDKLGNLIKIPLGIHRKTLKRCIFIDANGNPYMNQLEFIKRIKANSPEALKQAVAAITEIPDETVDHISRKPPVKIREGNLCSVEENCNVINFIVKKAKSLNDLLHEERVVLLYTFAPLGDAGKQYVHEIISHCRDYDYNITEDYLNRAYNSPISCMRIRKKLFELVKNIKCDCRFIVPEQGYPSPILYYDKEFTKGKSLFKKRMQEDSKVITKYFDIIKNVIRMKSEKEHIEFELNEMFDNMHEDEIILGDIKIKRETGENGKTIFKIENIER